MRFDEKFNTIISTVEECLREIIAKYYSERSAFERACSKNYGVRMAALVRGEGMTPLMEPMTLEDVLINNNLVRLETADKILNEPIDDSLATDESETDHIEPFYIEPEYIEPEYIENVGIINNDTLTFNLYDIDSRAQLLTILSCQSLYDISIEVVFTLYSLLIIKDKRHLEKACENLLESQDGSHLDLYSQYEKDLLYLIANYDLFWDEAKEIIESVREYENIPVEDIDETYLIWVSIYNITDENCVKRLPYGKYKKIISKIMSEGYTYANYIRRIDRLPQMSHKRSVMRAAIEFTNKYVTIEEAMDFIEKNGDPSSIAKRYLRRGSESERTKRSSKRKDTSPADPWEIFDRHKLNIFRIEAIFLEAINNKQTIKETCEKMVQELSQMDGKFISYDRSYSEFNRFIFQNRKESPPHIIYPSEYYELCDNIIPATLPLHSQYLTYYGLNNNWFESLEVGNRKANAFIEKYIGNNDTSEPPDSSDSDELCNNMQVKMKEHLRPYQTRKIGDWTIIVDDEDTIRLRKKKAPKLEMNIVSLRQEAKKLYKTYGSHIHYDENYYLYDGMDYDFNYDSDYDYNYDGDYDADYNGEFNFDSLDRDYYESYFEAQYDYDYDYFMGDDEDYVPDEYSLILEPNMLCDVIEFVGENFGIDIQNLDEIDEYGIDIIKKITQIIEIWNSQVLGRGYNEIKSLMKKRDSRQFKNSHDRSFQYDCLTDDDITL